MPSDVSGPVVNRGGGMLALTHQIKYSAPNQKQLRLRADRVVAKDVLERAEQCAFAVCPGTMEKEQNVLADLAC